MSMTEAQRKEFYAIRKAERLKIDPATAEIWWSWVETLDPYGIEGDLPDDCCQVGREYFARNPGSEICVWFYDLPAATRKALEKVSERGPMDLSNRMRDAIAAMTDTDIMTIVHRYAEKGDRLPKEIIARLSKTEIAEVCAIYRKAAERHLAHADELGEFVEQREPDQNQ